MRFWCLSHCQGMKAQASQTNQSLHCLHTQSTDIDEDSGPNLDPYLTVSEPCKHGCLTHYLLEVSADSLCKQIGPRIGPTKFGA